MLSADEIREGKEITETIKSLSTTGKIYVNIFASRILAAENLYDKEKQPDKAG
ncbi:hypothetical protein MUJ63_08040 [Lachnospiraceae bacterium NSJ-143]|nr:hypothetical protein [Lachnospiraceae bacterium NSJ-143]